MELIKTILPITLVALSLYACGGPVENDAPVVNDTTAPIFLNGDPEGSVTEACSITAEFDKPISESSVTDQSFIIEDPSGTQLLEANMDGIWQLHPDSATIALFVPKITIFGTYTVTVTTDITDTAGNPLEVAPPPWTFTTTLPCAPSI